MRRKIINIDTDENKKEVFEKFNSVNSKHQAHILFGISDNRSGSEYLKEIAQEIGFDLNVYKQRKEKLKRYCLQCGKEILSRHNQKFCCRSCATTYQNLHTIKTEETKRKISESLKKINQKKTCSCNKETVKPKKNKLINIKNNKSNNKKNYCLYCGKEVATKRKFCSLECFNKNLQKERAKKWLLNGTLNIGSNSALPITVKRYLLEKNNYRCEECGFEGYNRKTGNSILQFHHKDGNSNNNSPENIQVLCPNCHAMTENYMALNKGHSARDKRYK